jgi:tripartite-type tricarboxylate transporter receptor subunit TctC
MVWFGLFAPAGTPKPIIDLLNGKANIALAESAVREGLEKLGMEAAGGSPEVLANKVQSEMQKWGSLVREKNIRVDQ